MHRPIAFLLFGLLCHAQEQPQYSDKPKFTAAGVPDHTYRAGHGSDAVQRSAETLTRATASLGTTEASSEANLFNRGTELLNRHASRAAAEVFAKGARQFPQSTRMLLGLASAWYSAGLYDKAAEWYFKAADLKPEDATPYEFLGKVEARAITESTGYRERMARFLRVQPNNALANYYYALLLGSEGRPLLEKAVAIDPHLELAYLQRGILEAQEGRYRDAIVYYQKAPDLQEAHYRLSEAYRLTGDPVKAKQEMTLYKRQ